MSFERNNAFMQKNSILDVSQEITAISGPTVDPISGGPLSSVASRGLVSSK